MIDAPRLLAPGIRMAHVPGEVFGFPQGNNVYLLGEHDPVLVDTGLPGDVGEAVLGELFESAGLSGGPRRLMVTHFHQDHCGSFPWLKERFGTTLAAHPNEADDAYAALGADAIDEELDDGVRLVVDGLEVDVVFTPGHSPGHLVFHVPSERLLLTGDLIVGSGTSWVGPPTGSLVDYLASLRRVRTLDSGRLLPAHGPLVDDPIAKIDEYLEHRAERELQVLDCVGSGVAAVPEMVRRIYAGYPEGVLGLASLTVLGHLRKLIDEGRVRMEAHEGDNRYHLIG